MSKLRFSRVPRSRGQAACLDQSRRESRHVERFLSALSRVLNQTTSRRSVIGVVLIVLGLCWASVGAAHLVRLSQMTGPNAPSDGMAAFGSLLDIVVFIIPGVMVAIIGVVLRWRAKRAPQRAP